MKPRLGLPLLLIAIYTAIGCASGGSPVGQDINAPIAPRSSAAHQLLGLYTFVCDPVARSIDVVSLRHPQMHLNALKFLEPPAGVFLSLQSKPQFNGNILDVDIGLTNPYLGKLEYSGFDVCGIVFTHGSYAGFSDPEIVIAGDGDTRLLNPDGYTRWWNPAEFPHGDTIFNYIDGLIGTPAGSADFNCSINGYKYFADGLEKNSPLTALDPAMRGMFGAGKQHVRHYTIDMSGGLIFNYAVDACWMKPHGSYPYTVPDDFPPGANRPEAYNVVITELENSLHYVDDTYISGGNLRLQVDVWDHFNAGLNEIYAESPLIGLPLAAALTPVGGGEGYSTYEIEFADQHLPRNGDAELFIVVQSEVSGYGGVLPGRPVCSYFKYAFTIGDTPRGWAVTWDNGLPDYSPYEVALDNLGNSYVTGYFSGTVDFDPGPGIDECSANGSTDAYLVKYNPNGVHQWARTWGGQVYDEGRGVAVDPAGDIYVAGQFWKTVDFDPGPGVAELTSNGADDAYLCKFSSSGDFQWVGSWGSNVGDSAYDVAADGFGNVYVTGNFSKTVDFDPGAEIVERTSNGMTDAFLCKFDSNGVFQWVLTWGAEKGDKGNGLAVDNSGNVYVLGFFDGTTDLDPGPGVDEHVAENNDASFLSKFNPDGDFLWGRSWGTVFSYIGKDLTVAASGDAYVGGYFYEAQDFDPGPGVEMREAFGANDSYLTKFDTDGNFLWVRTWGGGAGEACRAVAADASGNIYAAGHFAGHPDFDPGPGVDEHFSNDWTDVYLSKFTSDGDFLWARTWGGEMQEEGYGVGTDLLGNCFAVGRFGATVDFDPGPGTDMHTSIHQYDEFLSKFPPDGNW